MEEKIFFEGNFGKICGILNNINYSNEIVIIVHGFSSTKDKASQRNISNKLNEIGKSNLRIDLDNQGESGLEFTKVSVSKYMNQVEAAINYCKTLGYENISLIGTSFGGVVVLKLAELYPCLKRVLLRCPGAGFYYRYLTKEKEEVYRRAKKEGFVVRGELEFDFDLIEDLKQYFPLFEIAKEVNILVGIIVGDKDEVIDYRDTIEFSKEIKNARIYLIEGAGHDLNVNSKSLESDNALIEFFKEDLK